MRKLWNSSINLLFVYFVNLILLVSANSLLTLILQELSTTQEIEDIVQLSETDRLQIAFTHKELLKLSLMTLVW